MALPRLKLTLPAVALLLLPWGYVNEADAGLVNPGDLAIVGYDSGTNDFSLLALSDIAASTTFFLTDEGWDNSTGGFVSSAFDSTVTWTTGSTISAGTILHASSGLGGTVSGMLDFSIGGDSLIIYQTADDIAATNPKHFVYGFNANDFGAETTGGWQTGTPSSQSSNLPTGTNVAPGTVTEVTSIGGPGNFFGLLGENGSVAGSDQYAFQGPLGSAGKDEWLSRLHDPDNWMTGNGGAFDVPATVAEGASNVPVEGSAVIPEPNSLAIFGLGVLGALGLGWRRREEAGCDK